MSAQDLNVYYVTPRVPSLHVLVTNRCFKSSALQRKPKQPVSLPYCPIKLNISTKNFTLNQTRPGLLLA